MKVYLLTFWHFLMNVMRTLGAHFGWRRERLFHSTFVDDVPEVLKDHIVYLVGSPGTPWLAALLCPCGCKAQLLLNLLPAERPCWSVTQKRKGVISLHPSIWRQVDCCSHFFLRDGVVQWCTNGTPNEEQPQ